MRGILRPGWWPLAVAPETNRLIAPLTTIEVGGPADLFYTPASWNEVADIVAARPADLPLTLLGLGSNMVVRDGGLRGLVLHLGKGCDEVRVEDDSVFAEAGAANGKAARAAREANLTGLEFFGGIPGSIGGALRMNAGAYGSETFDKLEKIWVIDDKGATHEVTPDFVRPCYRHTELPAGWVFRAGLWKLQPGDREEIRQRMREINHARSSTQPLHMPSSGSWFKNPMVNGEKKNAWKVVEDAGCRGLKVGGAQVSEQHANFFVNTGGATAKDLDALSREVEKRVQEKLGVVLEREVRMIGEE
ncbi:MAG TPA: UDP-N-acetylmuramate dehydrogenase [Alphaproteobacteria bacterium]|nr:UDP-N-acetylmuramate dehydrogenase [Alphaproteobacteria bacterium]